eukprot:TRINITY_DN34036_c0_g1_i1.p1 TRINITY_DN34036_c0_g1~~TRINITY_DN34036_c0_g1_i1.p1  ORF type:complete len:563 (+),score=59.67 TRINITY_DN34036_c0_g1_i1:106-1794(+)
MARLSGSGDVISLVDRRLAEEQEKIVEFLWASRTAVVTRLEEDLADLRHERCDDVLLQMNGSHATGTCLGETFATLTCNKLLEPTGDTNSSMLPESFFQDKPASTSGDEPTKNISSPTNRIFNSVASTVMEHAGSLAEISQELAQSTSSRGVKRIRDHDPVQTSRAKRIFTSPTFESVLAGLILFNAICLGLEQQYQGIDTGYKLKAPGANRPAREVWPRAESFFLMMELFFGVLFTAEAIAKVAVFRWEFFKSLWNLYDSLIIACWMVQGLSILDVPTDPLMLRMALIGRLLRLLRFAKAFQIFDVLHLLIRSLVACLSALMWSALCLALVMMATAIFLIYMLQAELENDSIPLEERLKLYKYFGTFTNGLFSMYEITMGGWVGITRTVVDTAGDGYILFFVVYRTIVGFAVLSVINSIFNAETLRITQSDDEVLLLHKEREMAANVRRVRRLMLEADGSNDGVISFEEFMVVIQDPAIKRWLLAQGIAITDVDLAFRMIDESGDGRLSVEELVRGLDKLKGVASNADVIAITHALSRVETLLLDNTLGVLAERDAGATKQ